MISCCVTGESGTTNSYCTPLAGTNTTTAARSRGREARNRPRIWRKAIGYGSQGRMHPSSRANPHVLNFTVHDGDGNSGRPAADLAINDKLGAAFAGIERDFELFTAVGTDNVYRRWSL